MFAALLTIFAIGTALGGPGHDNAKGIVLVPLAIVQAATLAVRRRWPLGVLAVIFAAAAVSDLLTGDFYPLAIPVGLYTAAAYGDRRRALRLVAVQAVVALLLIVHDNAYNFGVVAI